jgi:hypothetical protein
MPVMERVRGHKKAIKRLNLMAKMVGPTGFEPSLRLFLLIMPCEGFFVLSLILC